VLRTLPALLATAPELCALEVVDERGRAAGIHFNPFLARPYISLGCVKHTRNRAVRAPYCDERVVLQARGWIAAGQTNGGDLRGCRAAQERGQVDVVTAFADEAATATLRIVHPVVR